MNKSILIVDDEDNIRNLLAVYLRKEGFEIYQADNGVEALNIIKSNQIDFVVMDIMMPVMDGFETLKILRKDSNVPVMMLSARAEDEDKLFALGFGADNYETKPFSPKVLVAKVKAQIKRIYENEDKDQHKNLEGLIFGSLYISEKAHKVVLNKEELNLSPTEFSLLIYFVNNKGIVLTREQILTAIWGYDFEGDLRVVDTTVKRLREKLKESANLITTVRGFGYKFQGDGEI
ncbi:response regulator transcription factor [Clostridium sp. UBA4548]|uniref:response regulator transcription factor n=1 Tax=Clostridium sp. UBA4548 TaxID=1946361 RepID=UPI0025C2F6B9|nr:response regulator transcription factor [Clostridium sp. UBA4548]